MWQLSKAVYKTCIRRRSLVYERSPFLLLYIDIAFYVNIFCWLLLTWKPSALYDYRRLFLLVLVSLLTIQNINTEKAVCMVFCRRLFIIAVLIINSYVLSVAHISAIFVANACKLWRLASEFILKEEVVCDRVWKSNAYHCNHHFSYRTALFPTKIRIRA